MGTAEEDGKQRGHDDILGFPFALKEGEPMVTEEATAEPVFMEICPSGSNGIPPRRKVPRDIL